MSFYILFFFTNKWKYTYYWHCSLRKPFKETSWEYNSLIMQAALDVLNFDKNK